MFPRSTILRAGCKINLYLRVNEKLPNGYHELDTLFLPLSQPYDTIEIIQKNAESGKSGGTDEATGAEQKQQGIRVEFSVPGIDPERNTLTKAYAWYASLTGFAPALSVRVAKNIPHGAGLGGGSSDAAALLRYLQEEAAKAGYPPLGQAELLEGAASIGADVPFFLLGTAAQATGVGEKLVPVANPFASYFLVLVCPDVAVSTAWAFAALDELRSGANSGGAAEVENSREPAPSGDKRQKMEKSQISGLTSTGHQATYVFARERLPGNDFEDLVFTHLPVLARLYARLCGTAAEVTRMSGTGSSIFALFRNGNDAKETAKALASDGYRVYMQAL